MGLPNVAITGGVELVKFFLILAMQEARRANMTPDEIEAAYNMAKMQFEMKDPGEIPDV